MVTHLGWLVCNDHGYFGASGLEGPCLGIAHRGECPEGPKFLEAEDPPWVIYVPY
jgi:hypothetical protein